MLELSVACYILPVLELSVSTPVIASCASAILSCSVVVL